MQLQQGDILIKKSKGQSVYWLSERLVIDICGVSEEFLWVSRNRYKKSVKACFQNSNILPDTGKGWRWARINNRFYYAYNNIPNRKPTYYRMMLGTEQSLKDALKELENSFKLSLKETVKNQIQKEVAEMVQSIDIQYYQLKASVLFNYKKAKELAHAKAWFQYLKKELHHNNFKKKGIALKSDFLLICTEILEGKALEGLKVSNAHYLRNKLDKFPGTEAEQLEFFISGRYNNDNARIIGKSDLVDEDTGEIFKFDAHQALMYYAYMSPGRATKESLYQLYTHFYSEGISDFGLEPIAYRTFTKHLKAFHRDMKMTRQRHGKDYYKKTSLTYVPQKKLQYAHSLFCADGSGTINYQYYNAKNELKTKKLYVMLISDVASRKIVGYSFAPKGVSKEDPKMLESALKMAIDNGEHQTMFEFISDNHGAFTSGESKKLLNNVFNKVRTIEVGNSQANPAEMMFRLFKRTLKGLSNFGSTSWGVGVEGQSNPDYFDIESFPTYEDAILQFCDIVEQWNATPLNDGVSPNKRFENKNPKCKPIDARILRKIYGNHTAVDVSYMRGFVQVSKTKGYTHRDTYLFEIPDYEGEGSETIARMTGYKTTAKVKVVWNEEMADLYNQEGTFIMSCPPAVLASPSHAEMDEGSDYALGHHLNRKAKQDAAVDEFEEILNDIFDDADLPYAHQMKTGGNKTTYNENMEQKEESIKKQAINKGFNQDW